MPRPRKKKFSYFYIAYLKSPAWRARSKACIARALGRCENCGTPKGPGVSLQAHHLVYLRLGHELPSDLMALCSRCHPHADQIRRRNSAIQRRRFR